MSAIGQIGRMFAIGRKNDAAFGQQSAAGSKMSLSRSGGDGGDFDEVDYAALNDSDTNFDLDMIKFGLEYEAYKNMEKSEKEREKE